MNLGLRGSGFLKKRISFMSRLSQKNVHKKHFGGSLHNFM